jgi:hypothetical protein
MNRCKHKEIDTETHDEKRCDRMVHDRFDYCCMHDQDYHTGCRYNYRLNEKTAMLEEYCTRCGNTKPPTI